MKLVNVDDLKVLVAVESTGEIRYGKLVTELFDDIPIVEAIPIKWIEKKITEYIINNRYGSDAVPIIYALLSDWRKENAGILQRD